MQQSNDAEVIEFPRAGSAGTADDISRGLGEDSGSTYVYVISSAVPLSVHALDSSEGRAVAQPTFQVISPTVVQSVPGKSRAQPEGELENKVEQLESRVAALEEATEEVVVLRTVDRKQAKQEILGLFQTAETLYYSDIARRLRIDLPLVVELCTELQGEGEIEIDADYPI